MNGNNQDNQNNLNNGVGMDPSSLGGVPLGNPTISNPEVNPAAVNVSDTTQVSTPPSAEEQVNLVQSAIENIQSSIDPALQSTPVSENSDVAPVNIGIAAEEQVTTPNPIGNVEQQNVDVPPVNNVEPTNEVNINPINNPTAVDSTESLMDNNPVNEQVIPQTDNMQYSATPQTSSVLQPIPGTNANASVNSQAIGNSNGFVEPKKEESIGTIPPEQKPKKKNGISKFLFILLILALMAGVAYGVYYYLSLGKKANDIKIELKDVVLELNSEVPDDISTYATITGTDSKNCSVITSGIDTSKAGNYKFSVKCGDQKQEGSATVVEDSELTIDLQEVVVSVGAQNVLAEDFVVADSCNKKDCKFSFVDKSKVDEYLKTAGTYEVDIKVSADNLEGTVKGSLVVINEEIKLYLSCSKESDNKTVTDKLAMGGENTYIGLAYRTYEYTFNSEEDYKDAIKDKASTITYDDITGKATYNDNDKTLTISNKLTDDVLKTEFASDLPSAYVDFFNHYTENGYTCTIER